MTVYDCPGLVNYGHSPLMSFYFECANQCWA